MKKNTLEIIINRAVAEVFVFAITPPNSTKWIPGVVKEETDEFPIRVGTVYSLTDTEGNVSKVKVIALEEDKMVEWVSEDGNYHCRYVFKPINKDSCEMEYLEWVNEGKIEGPFTGSILQGLKRVLEKVSDT